MAACAICGRRTAVTFQVCKNCEREHGLTGPYQDWPNWVKALANCEQRERRYEAQWQEYRPQYEILQTRPDQAGGIADAPYEDKAANQAYRKTNRLKGGG